MQIIVEMIIRISGWRLRDLRKFNLAVTRPRDGMWSFRGEEIWGKAKRREADQRQLQAYLSNL
jgi:superfamily I DNA and/or RNA helicase